MTAIERQFLDIVRPAPPHSEGRTRFVAEISAAPDDQYRTRDASARGEVGVIIRAIDSGARAVILTSRCEHGGVAELGDVVLYRPRMECVATPGPPRQQMFDVESRIGSNEMFGNRSRHGEELPVISAERL